MDKGKDWIERDVRYRISKDLSLPATVLRGGAPGEERIQADLIDMSHSGLKLSVPTKLACHEVIQVHVANEELGLNLTESAQVRWVRQEADSDAWAVGCDITGDIHVDVLEALAERGLLDRRYSLRRRITAEALAQWELSGDSVPVQLLNLSTGGFCLASDQPTKVGSRLKLTLTDDEGESSSEILARAKWQHEFDNGYLIGCDMTLDDVFDLVGYFASSGRTPSAHPSRRRILSVAAGVAMLAVLAVLYASGVVF